MLQIKLLTHSGVIESYKTSRDQGETLDLENLLSEIVAVFSNEAEEAEPTLQAAMLATTTRPEYQEPRPTSVPGGTDRLRTQTAVQSVGMMRIGLSRLTNPICLRGYSNSQQHQIQSRNYQETCMYSRDTQAE